MESTDTVNNTLTDDILKVLGTQLILPLAHGVENFDLELLEKLAATIRSRFSEDGRIAHAKNVCTNLDYFGFRVPTGEEIDGELEFHSFEECTDHIFESDYELYTDDMVSQALEYIDAIIAQKQEQTQDEKVEQAPVQPSL